MDTIEGNKIIAEFMELLWDKDWKKYGKRGIGGDGKGGFGWYEPVTMGYHTSWDWLIPVVEKIENLEYDVYIDSQYYTTNDDKNYSHSHNCNISDLVGKTVSEKAGNDKKEAVWLAVVEFIKWYNQNKK